MSTKQDMQRLIRVYKDETGEREVDMQKVARFAVANGWPLPLPTSPIDALSKKFSDAARVEIRRDKKTGKPYRANHAIPVAGQLTFVWIDIDEAARKPMLKSLINRREQMVGDGLQLTLDADHWNSVNLGDEPINLPMDLTLDIEWRKNAPNEDDKAA